ncbi:MAG: DUF4159 domain-containing protein [Planctomycetales bacterium]|nr:DUF4159 domain-containing protein [Planctomycetales bacterium]
MIKFLSQLPRRLGQLTGGYAVLWPLAMLAWSTDEWLPTWLLAIVFSASLPLGVEWLRLIRTRYGNDRKAQALVGSAIYPFWWQLIVFWSDLLGLSDLRSGMASVGTLGLFLIGLAWLVWGLERASRRIELTRIDEALRNGPRLHSSPASSGPTVDSAGRRRRIWNPLDPLAWYYGRSSRKLKQSTSALVTYGIVFWLAALMLSQLRGCQRIYELPAGGGVQKTVAQTVKIQKVIRKKFVVNPLSAIKFAVPPIDEVKLQLQEVTAHQYMIGYGEGTGAGFAGGTQRGKVRLIRFEYDGGDWNLNFGIGGDGNMLLEYGLLTQQKVAEKTESIRIAHLASFPREKSPPVIFLTGQGSLSVSNSDVKLLREYLQDKHGMVFASSGSRHFHNQFLALMNRVLPDVRPVPVPVDDSIHRVPFLIPSFPYVVPHGGKEPLGWSTDGRWLVYYHPGDISDAWADGHSGVAPEIYNGCFQLGANVINYGHVEYSKWLQAKAPGTGTGK